MIFSSKPDMHTQVESIQKNVRSRLWTLRNLKSSGFTEDKLINVYKTIRPVLDYGCLVYHSSLTNEQDELIDNLQNVTLRCLWPRGVS